MKKVTVASLSDWIAGNMVEGIRKHGYTVNLQDFKSPVDADILVIMGWHDKGAIQYTQKYRPKIPVLIITDGYLKRRKYAQDREHKYPDWVHFGVSLSYPAGYSQIPYRSNYPDDRLGIKIQPKTTGGKDIMVAYQKGKDALGRERESFYRDVTRTIKDYVLRIHPTFRPDKKELVNVLGRNKYHMMPLEQHLENVETVISFDSNINVESAAMSRTIFEQGRSMAWPVAFKWGKKDYKPVETNKQNWLNWLSYQQWTKQEMSNGKCWDYIIKEVIN